MLRCVQRLWRGRRRLGDEDRYGNGYADGDSDAYGERDGDTAAADRHSDAAADRYASAALVGIGLALRH